MPRDPDANPPLPPDLSEELLCDLVEGLLPEAEARRVREALSGSPDWARVVAQMESHRRVLTRIPDEPPPADLLDRVQASLERDALLGLTQGERLAGPAPVIGADRDPGVLAQLGARLWRPLAAAAGIALVALGGVYWARNLSRHAPPPASPGPIALQTTPEPDAPSIAAAEPATEAPTAAPGVSRDAAPAARALAAADTPSADMTPQRTLALAREGRLLVRVVAERASAAESAIEAIASLRGDPVRGITVESDVPPEVLAAASAPPPAVVGPSPRVQPESIMASERAASPFDPLALVPPGVLSPWLPVELPPALGRTFLLEMPGTGSSMESLRRTLSARLGGDVRVEFEELASPAVPPPIDAASLLWWTGPASTWAPRVAVPVVVEHLR